jgi:uncharacterized protein
LEASVIENLAALQEIDRRNRTRKLELADIERETSEQQALLDEKRALVASLRTELDALVERRRLLESQHAQDEQRMKERRMRLGRLRNDKEIGALHREIEVAKEANARLEEDVLTVIEQVESLEGTCRTAEEEQKALEKSLAKLGQSGTGRTRQLRAEIEGETAQRNEIAGRLGDPVRRKYEQLFAHRNGVAVAEVQRGSCRGCNMHIPPQLFIRVQRRTEIEYCPNCQRILYVRIESSNGTEANEA